MFFIIYDFPAVVWCNCPSRSWRSFDTSKSTFLEPLGSSDGTREDQRGTKSQRNWGKWSGSWVGMWRGLKALLVFGSWLDRGWYPGDYHNHSQSMSWECLSQTTSYGPMVFLGIFISLGRHEETKPWRNNFWCSGVRVLRASSPMPELMHQSFAYVFPGSQISYYGFVWNDME